MHYPLNLTFKIISLSPQFHLSDAAGRSVFYVKQKLFKLKESVNVFADVHKQNLRYEINADKVIDWSAKYTFTDAAGNVLGAVKRQGMRSLWRARYDVVESDGGENFNIQEENPWSKVGDQFFQQIPLVGAFAGYVFHPSFLVSRPDGTPAMRMRKIPAMWEGRFQVDRLLELDETEEQRILLSLMMMVLLERRRG